MSESKLSYEDAIHRLLNAVDHGTHDELFTLNPTIREALFHNDPQLAEYVALERRKAFASKVSPKRFYLALPLVIGHFKQMKAMPKMFEGLVEKIIGHTGYKKITSLDELPPQILASMPAEIKKDIEKAINENGSIMMQMQGFDGTDDEPDEPDEPFYPKFSDN